MYICNAEITEEEEEEGEKKDSCLKAGCVLLVPKSFVQFKQNY